MIEKDIYLEFLNLLDVPEAEKEKPYLVRICSRFHVTEEILQRCCSKYLPQYFHMELSGIRALLRLYVMEWISYERLWDERAVKIYYNVPGTNTGMYWLRDSLRQAGYHSVVCTPDLVTMIVLYGIIGVEEKLAVSNGCRHCGVNLMRELLSEKHMIPAPDIRWTYGLLCNEAPKQDMILEDREPDALHVLIYKPAKCGSQKKYLQCQIERGIAKVKEQYYIEESGELYKKAKKKRFMLAMRIEQILRFLNQTSRFVIGNEEIGLIETLLLASFQTDADEIADLLAELLKEMKCRVSKEKYPSMKYRYAVYYTPICNPEYGRIMETHGIALLWHTAFASTAVAIGGENYAEDMALECMGLLIGKSVDEETEKICEILEKNRLDGLVLGMFSFDRWMGAMQNHIKRIVEERTGKHVFLYETDFWNQEAFAGSRMENLVETLVFCRHERGCYERDYEYYL